MQVRKRERRTVRKIIKVGDPAGRKDAPETKNRLSKSLDENINILREKFNNDSTVIFRNFRKRFMPGLKCCIVFIEGMIDINHINRQIIEPIMEQDLRNLSVTLYSHPGSEV